MQRLTSDQMMAIGKKIAEFLQEKKLDIKSANMMIRMENTSN